MTVDEVVRQQHMRTVGTLNHEWVFREQQDGHTGQFSHPHQPIIDQTGQDGRIQRIVLLERRRQDRGILRRRRGDLIAALLVLRLRQGEASLGGTESRISSGARYARAF